MQSNISRVFQKLGVESDERGCAIVEQDGVKVVMLDCGDNGLVLYSVVGLLPDNPVKELIDTLLDVVRPGRLGLDESSQTLLYSMAIPLLQIDYGLVSKTLQIFAETARPLAIQIEDLSRPVVPEAGLGNVGGIYPDMLLV